jgi:hypothetical protein
MFLASRRLGLETDRAVVVAVVIDHASLDVRSTNVHADEIERLLHG